LPAAVTGLEMSANKAKQLTNIIELITVNRFVFIMMSPNVSVFLLLYYLTFYYLTTVSIDNGTTTNMQHLPFLRRLYLYAGESPNIRKSS
jgi:hypothetical protein